MSTIIGIKDFRKSLATIADEVMKGKSYTVMRRSKPAFTVAAAYLTALGLRALAGLSKMKN